MGLINKISKAKDDEVRWNFTKFLIDKEGNLIKRFEPVNKLEDVKEAIENLLK
jgi:glutathione peroxidase